MRPLRQRLQRRGITGTDAQTERPYRATYHSDNSDPFRFLQLTANSQSPTANPHLHLFTGKFVRFPPFSNIHVENLKSPRGRQKIPPKFHLIPPKFHFILPKFYFAPTWRIFLPHVGISKYPRGNHFSPTQRRIDV